MECKIGQEIEITQDFEIESVFGQKLQVKEGDKGFVDCRSDIHYTTGAARGKIQRLADLELKGYDHENIAKMILKRLNGYFGLTEILVDYDIDQKRVIEEIEDLLMDIL